MLGLVDQLGQLVTVAAGPVAHGLDRLHAEDALEQAGALAAGRGQQPVELSLRKQDGGDEAVEVQLQQRLDLLVDRPLVVDVLVSVEVLQQVTGRGRVGVEDAGDPPALPVVGEGEVHGHL